VALDVGTPSLPLDGIFAFAKERTVSFGLTDLTLTLKGSSRAKPKSVIKLVTGGRRRRRRRRSTTRSGRTMAAPSAPSTAGAPLK
jgi:hypothetical protein